MTSLSIGIASGVYLVGGGGAPNLPEFQKPQEFFQIVIHLCNKHQTAVIICTVGTNLKKFSKTTYLLFYSSFRVFMHPSSYVCFHNHNSYAIIYYLVANTNLS